MQADFVANRDATVELYGGKKRSAGGRDKIAPWAHPGIDFDGTADRADSGLVSKNEKGHKDYDTALDTRVRVSVEDLFDKGMEDPNDTERPTKEKESEEHDE